MLHCFYIDWDMVVDDFTFATDPGAWPELDHAAHGEDAGLEYVRRVAMDTPRVVCGILADAGYVAHGSTVQVVVVEGTRGRKVGIHFVFKTLATRETHREVWGAILEAIEARVGRSAFQVCPERSPHARTQHASNPAWTNQAVPTVTEFVTIGTAWASRARHTLATRSPHARHTLARTLATRTHAARKHAHNV
jgi:hypothetical protein